MRRCPSPLYLRELAQGCPGFSTTEILDAVCELEAEGLVLPSTWKLTDEGRAAAVVLEGQAAA